VKTPKRGRLGTTNEETRVAVPKTSSLILFLEEPGTNATMKQKRKVWNL
jgi:hypothetical protein